MELRDQLALERGCWVVRWEAQTGWDRPSGAPVGGADAPGKDSRARKDLPEHDMKHPLEVFRSVAMSAQAMASWSKCGSGLRRHVMLEVHSSVSERMSSNSTCTARTISFERQLQVLVFAQITLICRAALSMISVGLFRNPVSF